MSPKLIETVSFWTGVLAVSLTALAALCGLLFKYFSGLDAKIKADALDRYKQSTGAAIATSQEHAARADAIAAKANERAAGLEKQAAEARLELERIRAREHNRTLTEAEKKAIATAFADAPTHIVVRISSSNDDESSRLAEEWLQFIRSLIGDRNEIRGGRMMSSLNMPDRPPGVSLAARDDDPASLTIVARLAALLVPLGHPEKRFPGPYSSGSSIEISIGAKPPR
jgi:hypothetical protein